MNLQDRELYRDLSDQYNNVINENGRIWVLPHTIQTFSMVKVFLTENRSCIVESQHAPIRHGKHCGSRVHLGTHYGKIDYAPVFYWNGKEWLLNTFGTFLFAEIELNTEERGACN